MANAEASFKHSPLTGLVQQGQLWLSEQHRTTRRAMVGTLLILALLAFELFNFDTTEYALENLLGGISFAGVRWATILAIAFCSIDFAGLARLLTPDAGSGGGLFKSTTLLLGAWLLGGGMNAVMTWWSVSLALMGHNLGNELLSREQLLRAVPIFVALLVWITRLLIIGSLLMAADQAMARRASRREMRQAAGYPPLNPPQEGGGMDARGGKEKRSSTSSRLTREERPSLVPLKIRAQSPSRRRRVN